MTKGLKLRGPLILSLLLLLTGSLLVVALSGYLTEASENNYRQSLSNALEQAALNVNDRMGAAVSAMRYMMYSNAMTMAITIQEDNITMSYQLQEIKNLRSLVQSTMAEKDTALVRIYMNNYKLLTREGINFFALDALDSLPPSAGTMEWQAVHRITTKFFDQEVISLRAALANPYRYGELGAVLVIDQNPQRYQEILNIFALPDSSAVIALTDSFGTPFLTAGADQPDRELLKKSILEEQSSGKLTSSNGEEMVYWALPLEYAGWRLCLYTPRSSLLAGDGAFRSLQPFLYGGLLLLVLLFCILLFVFVYTRKLHQYIRYVNQTIQATGDVQNHHPTGLKDVFDLDGNISELLETIDTLTKRNYESQLRERSANLRMLQAQINPHFLYNTLDTIHWMSLRENAPGVAEMLEKLAEYFRLSLSRGQSVITFQTEVQITKAYLELCSCHAARPFVTVWDIDESCLNAEIPKMTLQPLVENALLHGIYCRKEQEPGQIVITAIVQMGRLKLTISNDGPPLSQDKPIAFSSFGLTNVEERLDLLAKGDYSIELKNWEDRGVCVAVDLPYFTAPGKPPFS